MEDKTVVTTPPPPPSEVKIRTMRSDIESMMRSGGGAPSFQNVSVTGLSMEKEFKPPTTFVADADARPPRPHRRCRRTHAAAARASRLTGRRSVRRSRMPSSGQRSYPEADRRHSWRSSRSAVVGYFAYTYIHKIKNPCASRQMTVRRRMLFLL